MKKLILSVAMLCVTGIFYAQTTFSTNNPFYSSSGQWASEVSAQAAPDESPCVDCEVDQIVRMTYNPYDTENMSLINQTGDRNDANVFQTGQVNYSAVNQDGYSGLIEGFDNDANVYQEGDRNYSDVGQHGEFNQGDVIQIGNDNYSMQNVGTGWAEYNSAYVRQEGDGNASSQTQWYDGNDAKIEQLTDNNEATQIQTSTNTHMAGTGNSASIWQYGGDDNVAFQEQTGTKNSAFSEQNGMGNTSKSTQSGIGNSGDGIYSNFARTLQIGDNNLACVDQDGGMLGANGSWIYQLGNDNKAGVSQETSASGWGNLSYISQYGNSNTASVTQINGSN
ncbi:hypothetical protein ACFQ5N_08220 [Lutibacter holmesii]|uniref:Curlin associated repeat-containing protein n=1 Tax=Lutibacter holmesii TaxID=1137985 RepID=A0ABW3WN77_9FLAO